MIKTRDAKAGQTGMTRALRDPFVCREWGKRYLLYSVAGERAIAIAELKDCPASG